MGFVLAVCLTIPVVHFVCRKSIGIILFKQEMLPWAKYVSSYLTTPMVSRA